MSLIGADSKTGSTPNTALSIDEKFRLGADRFWIMAPLTLKMTTL
jgi:hypothetical protein